MTRRKFILGLLVLIATVAGGILFIVPFESIVGKILRKQLSYLNVDEDAIGRFTQDISASGYYARKDFGWKKQAFVNVFYFLENPWIPLPGHQRFKLYSSFFVSDFLLSTDFFLNKMDEGRKVTYIALYEPYKRPCSNPFSNLFYPAA